MAESKSFLFANAVRALSAAARGAGEPHDDDEGDEQDGPQRNVPRVEMKDETNTEQRGTNTQHTQHMHAHARQPWSGGVDVSWNRVATSASDSDRS